MNESKQLLILDSNREFFKDGEEVKLKVLVKDIPTLAIKVFEIQLIDYYLKNKRDIDYKINLDGLVVNEIQQFEYKQKKIIQHVEEFTFDSISKKSRGIFIIEFIGNQLSSRAVIKKGNLQLIKEETLTGHRFTILDENFQICDSPSSTGIWIDNRFYKAQLGGEILVPFIQNAQAFQAVVVHN